MKRISVLLFSLASMTVQAQDPEFTAIEKSLSDLFTAMRTGDSTLARQCFTAQATAATIAKDKSGKSYIRFEQSLDEFVRAVGSPHPEVWNEEVWNVKIQRDGDFAQVWCDYAFYVGKKFSHCGVDVMNLYKEEGRWKIFHLADTRRKTDCNIPENIQKKYN